MPRTTRTPVTAASRSLTPSFTAVDNANGEQFAHDGASEYLLEVKNASGSPINVTVKRNKSVDGSAVPDLVVSVPATTGDKLIGPIAPENPAYFRQVDGYVYLDYSAGTSVTACVYKLPTP